MIRREAAAGGVDRRRGGQHLRRDRRSGAAGAPDHPQAAPRAAGRDASSSPAARRRPSRKASPRCPRSIACSATRRSFRGKLGRARCRGQDLRRRHHGGDGRRRRIASTASRATPARSCRCRTAAITAAPSASSRSAAAIRARCRWPTWSRRRAGSPRTATREIVLTGVDITSYAQPADASALLVKQVLRERAGAQAAAAVVDQFGRGRRRSARRARKRAAADAASASVAAGRRRHDPQAHEAAAFARRRDCVLRHGAAAAAGRGVRRRHHRRLPDRDRGDVRPLARSRRRMRPDAAARVSVLAAARHAGRAHAAGPRRRDQGARPRLREKGEQALRRHLDSEIGARRRVLAERGGIGRTEQFTPVRLSAPVEPGVIVDAAIAGHDGRQLLAA